VVVTVTSVQQSAAEYVAGEISAPSGSPVSKAMSDHNASGSASENALRRLGNFSLIDASGKYIRREVELGDSRSEGDRDVIVWKLKPMDLAHLSAIQLRTPDVCNIRCVPAALKWTTPETRWFMVPFELHSIPER
jgi:hypothetical protein